MLIVGYDKNDLNENSYKKKRAIMFDKNKLVKLKNQLLMIIHLMLKNLILKLAAHLNQLQGN